MVVVELKPAVTLIPGDFVDNADESVNSQMNEALVLLQPLLDNRIPTFAVLGSASSPSALRPPRTHRLRAQPRPLTDRHFPCSGARGPGLTIWSSHLEPGIA